MVRLRAAAGRPALFVLCLSLAFEAGIAATAGATAVEVGYYMAPVFVENSNKIWTVREIPGLSGNFYLAFSTDHGTTWQTFGGQLPSDLTALPSSLFVHGGRVLIAEAPVPCRSARVLSVDLTTQAVSTVRYLDPTATILPWGWTLDGEDNLWAGQYGNTIAGAPPECRSNHPLNISYILQIADSQGNSVPSSSPSFVSRWTWQSCWAPESCFGSWLAPPGSTSSLHVHNIRYDASRELFVINSGDSPRALMLWNGNPTSAPSVVERCCEGAYIMTGFTGSAPLSDALYVGDDWTSAGRGNSIRRYPWLGGTLGAPTTLLTLPPSFDTPIFDLHPSGETELYFVNYDEPTPTEPNVRLSGLHRVRRNSVNVDFPSTPELLFYYQSSWRNIKYLAADRNNSIPPDMPYVFVFSVGTYNNAPVTVITRVTG